MTRFSHKAQYGAAMQRLALLVCCTLLAACSGEAEEQPIVPERDPATVQALGDQIMVDPDLAQQNEANAALTGGTDHSIPPIVNTREAIADAQQEAADLVGGTSNFATLGEPAISSDPIPESARYSVAELARLTDGLAPCADPASITASWAARLPKAFPIYPRGNTIDAAGHDGAKCSLRAVRFLTPVPREDVLRFYATRARTAGLAAKYTRHGEFDRLEGKKGGVAYSVTIRQRSSGISEVGLVTNGF